jgi:hypothetical protein
MTLLQKAVVRLATVIYLKSSLLRGMLKAISTRLTLWQILSSFLLITVFTTLVIILYSYFDDYLPEDYLRILDGAILYH